MRLITTATHDTSIQKTNEEGAKEDIQDIEASNVKMLQQKCIAHETMVATMEEIMEEEKRKCQLKI